MIETLGAPDGLLGRAVLEQMRLSQGDARLFNSSSAIRLTSAAST
jgi:hypothetical protein